MNNSVKDFEQFGKEMEKLLPFAGIRYSKIVFYIRINEDTEIVREKSSALRGGMGEMLLRANCISNRKCSECGFESECMVQRIMYSKFDKLPPNMQEGDSVGYTLSCTDYRRHLSAGDTVRFTLYLFGKTIVYFSQILNAFYALGQSGLGNGKCKFKIDKVLNLFGEPILEANNIYMERYRWQTLGEYVNFRIRKDFSEEIMSNTNEDGAELSLNFSTPASIKYQGNMIDDFNSDALCEALLRRLRILATFENRDVTETLNCREIRPMLIDRCSEEAGAYRHSDRRNQSMKLVGIKGTASFGNVSAFWLWIFIAGEITRVGKNTSFGFGKYNIESNNK